MKNIAKLRFYIDRNILDLFEVLHPQVLKI